MLIALPPFTLIGVALGVIVDFVSLVSLRMVCARAILARKSAEMPLSSSKRVKRRREAVGQQQSRRKNGDRLGGRVSDALGRTFALDIRGRWRSCWCGTPGRWTMCVCGRRSHHNHKQTQC